MFRSLVHAVPPRVRRRVLTVLPSKLDHALRTSYYRQPLIRRVALRSSASTLGRRHKSILAKPGVRMEAFGQRMWLCRTADRLSVEQVRRHNLDLVAGLLDRLGVDYFLVNTGSHLNHSVAVSAVHRARVVSQIASELRDEPAYVGVAPDGPRTEYVLTADLRPREFGTAPVVKLGQVFSSGCGRLVLGMAHACDIEFWDESPTGVLVAPRPNRITPAVSPEDRLPASITIRDRAFPTIAPFVKPPIGEVRFPIDVVYTWVDGEDPEWRAAKEHHLHLVGQESLSDLAANSARFLSRDELLYSLRSLTMYADWVRTIYLVTADQVPFWLDTTNPRLRLVSHTELFAGAGRLPTFNSHAIESRLHHIDGLSEHYLYLNDDVFFGRAVAPELFFHGNGLSKIFLSRAQLDLGPPNASEPPVMSAAKNNRALVSDNFDLNVTQKMKHVPHAQRRSVLFEMEERFPDLFAETAGHRFRSHRDLSIASSLHHYYAYATGRAVPGQIDYAYSDNSDPYTPKRLQRLRWLRNTDVICLNDTDLQGADAAQQADRLREFLENYYPVHSEFEKKVGATAPSSDRGQLDDVPEATPDARVSLAAQPIGRDGVGPVGPVGG